MLDRSCRRGYRSHMSRFIIETATVKCPHCGADYSAKFHKHGGDRRNGFFVCEVCKHVALEWTDRRYFDFQLVRRSNG